MKHPIKLPAAVAAVTTVAAIGAALALAGGAAAASGATVDVAKSPFGRILVDSKGRTLYDFPPDTRGTSTCYGACAALWPPLTTNGKPKAGPGVKAPLLGTTKRSDGRVEVTYGGHPLYYYVADTRRGETTGQGLNQFGAPWWVITPAGKEIHHGWEAKDVARGGGRVRPLPRGWSRGIGASRRDNKLLTECLRPRECGFAAPGIFKVESNVDSPSERRHDEKVRSCDRLRTDRVTGLRGAHERRHREVDAACEEVHGGPERGSGDWR